MAFLAWLGRYEHCSVGGYYYVMGPLLTFPRFAVIPEAWEHDRGKWTKDWMSGKPAAVLYFAFWKLKVCERRRATWPEVWWYWGFQEVAARPLAHGGGAE